MTRRSRLIVLAGGWTLFGTVQSVMAALTMSDPVEIALWYVSYFIPLAWTWALCTPLVGWWTQAVNARYTSLAARIAAHLPLLVTLALVQTLMRRSLTILLGEEVRIPFQATLLYFADATVASYLVALWLSRVLDANARLIDRERQTHALEGQLVAAQLEYLELQLRPHFLFNALSTVAELAHEAPKSAARMLRNLVSLLEAAVARHGRGLVTLDEELAAVRPYLDIQRIRFADWIVLDEQVPDETRSALVPQFILQPLIENAVHHGLIDRSARGRILIQAARDGERLRLAVIDNGVGLQTASYQRSRGLGLSNLRERLQTVFGPEGRLELSDQNGIGTAAVVDIPFRTPPLRATVADSAESRMAPAEAHRTESRQGDWLPNWVRQRPMVGLALLWTVVALLRVQHSYAYMLLRDRYTSEAIRTAVRVDVAAAAMWFLLTPLVLALVRLFPFRRDRIAIAAVGHTIGAFVIAFTHAALLRAVEDFEYPLQSWPVAQTYAWNVAVYVLLLIFAQFRNVQEWIRGRELAAERLRRALQDAQFQKVILELRPTVLLDTLNYLVSIVSSSAKRAERILADIGEFLRATLDAIGKHRVALRAEAAAAQAYARVIDAVVAPGLAVELAIPLHALDERVPTGILRALLDHALRDEGDSNMTIRIDVALDADSILVHAARSASRRNDGHAAAAHTLEEYAAQGAVEIIEATSRGTWVRIGRTARDNGGPKPQPVDPQILAISPALRLR